MIARAAALAALLCAAVPAAAQPAVTKSEVRSQKPSVTDRQLRDQLWGMFRKEDRRSKTTPTRMLDMVWLETPAYPTHVPDLCRSDMVAIQFSPVGGTGVADADTPVRAYGLDSYKRFLFLKLPDETAPKQDGPMRRDVWSGACAKLEDDDPRFFRAADEELAEQGYRALVRAARGVQAGQARLTCNLGMLAKRPCAEDFAEFARQPIMEIETCAAVEGVTCYRILGRDDLEARISVITTPSAYKGPEGQSMAEGTILSVDFTLLIVLWHQRPD